MATSESARDQAASTPATKPVIGVLLVRPATPLQAVLVWLGAQMFVSPYILCTNARVLDTTPLRPLRAGVPVLAVSLHGEHFVHSIGQLAVDDRRPPDGRTLYDMASLTKVVATTTISAPGSCANPVPMLTVVPGLI